MRFNVLIDPNLTDQENVNSNFNGLIGNDPKFLIESLIGFAVLFEKIRQNSQFYFLKSNISITDEELFEHVFRGVEFKNDLEREQFFKTTKNYAKIFREKKSKLEGGDDGK